MKTLFKQLIGPENASKLKRRFHRFLRAARGEFPENARFRVFTHPELQIFFGYYDVTPFGVDDLTLLACAAPPDNLTPQAETPLKIGYFNLTEDEPQFHSLAETTTWCWQQGCRLQWHPIDNKFILFNQLLDGRYGCVVMDRDSSKVVNEISTPIYSLSPDGETALSLNFSRLQRLRPGYGYNTLPDTSAGQLAPDDDGICQATLRDGAITLTHSLADLAAIDPALSMNEAEHYVNHLCYSPSGKRYLFFHLWTNGNARWSRLFIGDADSHALTLLESSAKVSHYAWKSDDEILMTVFDPELGFQYRLYQVAGGYQPFASEVLTGDGHPSWFPDKDWIVTDTYPDECGDRKLLLFNHITSKTRWIAAFPNPPIFWGELRCDLHPRLNCAGNQACVDYVVNEKRAMAVFDL